MNLNGFHYPEIPTAVYYFSTSNDRKVEVKFIGKDYVVGEWDVEFEVDGSFNITGGGDAYKIMATIIEIIRDFVKKEPIKVLIFYALKKSRIDLYRTMLRRFAQSDHFNFKEQRGTTRYGTPKSTFFLTAS